MKNFVNILVLAFMCAGCTENEFSIPDYESEIVVDGWIEEGEPAEVILTYSTPYFSEIDSFSIYDFVNARAKVSVSDGENEEVLVLRTEKNYFPPFVYRGLKIKGEVGKTYSLRIEQPPHYLTAQCILPDSPVIDSIWFSLNEGSDTLGSPYITIHDNPENQNYYRILTRRYAIDKRFYPSLIPNISDVLFKNDRFELQVFKGSDLAIIKNNDIYFHKNDSIIVKLYSLEKEIYDYWVSFHNEQFNSGNPFADSKILLKGNINGDGKGIWAAYGKKTVGIRGN